MKKINIKKFNLAVPAALVGLASSVAMAQQSGMTTYSDADAAITAIGTVAQSAFNTFSTTIVPLLLGALVLVGGLTLGKWIIKKIRP